MKKILILFVLGMLLVGCSKPEESRRAKYSEYLIDSLKACHQLGDLRDRFVKCFGRPLKYDATNDTQIYAPYQFKGEHSNFRFMVGQIKETRDAIELFLEKYRDREEHNFLSYIAFRSASEKLEMAHKYGEEAQQGKEIASYSENSLNLSLFGDYMGEVVKLADAFEIVHGMRDWLVTVQERQKEVYGEHHDHELSAPPAPATTPQPEAPKK